MEPVICDLLAELDPAAYVIDALPNMHGEPVAERTLNLVQTIRKRRPTTPIVLVESITHQTGRAWGNDGSPERAVNAPFRKAYAQLLGEGCPGLYYLEGGGLLGADGEGTVDGVHPTDLGFSRMAAAIGPVVAQALARAKP
jgi:lysophospholipase L1-like esterase